MSEPKSLEQLSKPVTLREVSQNSQVSMHEAAEFIQSKNCQATATSTHPGTSSSIYYPPLVPRYRTINKLIIVPDDDELNQRCEEFLKTMAFEFVFEHAGHQFWDLPYEHMPMTVVKQRITNSNSPYSAFGARSCVKDVCCLLKSVCKGEVAKESALEQMEMDGNWSATVRHYLNWKDFDVKFFGVSGTHMIEDVDLMYWLVDPNDERPAICINFGLKDNRMPIDTATLKTAAALERCGLCKRASGGLLKDRTSTNGYFYGPATLAWIVTLKLNLIIEELQKEGLELVTVYEVSLDDVAELMAQPQNATLRESMMKVSCQMESDGVPKKLTGERWKLWADEVSDLVLPCLISNCFVQV